MACAILAGTLTAGAAPAVAQEELPYDPPVGSRWIVRSEKVTEETRNGTRQRLSAVTTAELTIEEKSADGFRVSLEIRDSTVEGPSPRIELLRAFIAAARGTVVRGTLDHGGKPRHVENLAEVQAARRAAIDRMVAAAKPEKAAALRQLLTATLLRGDNPEHYFEDVTQLSLAQNSGMKVGEERRDSELVQSPFGAPVRVARTFRLESRDAASRKAKFVLTESYEPASMKAAALEIARRVGGVKASAKDVEQAAATIEMSFESRTELEVEDGMTRVIRKEKTLAASGPGSSRLKRDIETVTVSPAR
jgi:hypothetical protein